MNQPTREEIEEIKKRLDRIEQQQTEPIKITRLEIDSGSMHKRLDEVQEDTNILKIEIQGARADILQIRESQADLRDRLIEHSEDLKEIKGKQAAHSELLEQLINIGERSEATQDEHSKRFDKLEVVQDAHSKRFDKLEATQDEHSKRFDKLEATQDEHSKLLRAILARLPEPGGQ